MTSLSRVRPAFPSRLTMSEGPLSLLGPLPLPSVPPSVTRRHTPHFHDSLLASSRSVADGHRPGALEQHRPAIFQFWRPEVPGVSRG